MRVWEHPSERAQQKEGSALLGIPEDLVQFALESGPNNNNNNGSTSTAATDQMDKIRKRIQKRNLDDSAFSGATAEAQAQERHRLNRIQKQRKVEVVELSSDDDQDTKATGTDKPTDAKTNSKHKKEADYSDEWTNYPVKDGCVFLNAQHDEGEQDVLIDTRLSLILKPHQISGVRFIYDNIIESPATYKESAGFGCVLAHSMGLGKTIQVITFVDVLLTYTSAKHVLCVLPKNVLANWLHEFDHWLPVNRPQTQPTNEHSDTTLSVSEDTVTDGSTVVGCTTVTGTSTVPAAELDSDQKEESTENDGKKDDSAAAYSNKAESTCIKRAGRQFGVYQLNEASKSLQQRAALIEEWRANSGVLLIGYEMFRYLTCADKTKFVNSVKAGRQIKLKQMRDRQVRERAEREQRQQRTINQFLSTTEAEPNPIVMESEKNQVIDLAAAEKNNGSSTSEAAKEEEDKLRDGQYEDEVQTLLDNIRRALIDPGPDVIVCDEGHRIKEANTNITKALKSIKTKRRLVLTGYPLQNNLEEYYCMVDFVRPGYLGSRKQFRNMFEQPIKAGLLADSTPGDVRLARLRTHVLIDKLRGFVMRRSPNLLRAILPQNREFVLLCRKSSIQHRLYRQFIVNLRALLDDNDSETGSMNGANALEAFAINIKICNHPDILWSLLNDRKEALLSLLADLDLEEPEEAQSDKRKPKRPSRAKKRKKTDAAAVNSTQTSDMTRFLIQDTSDSASIPSTPGPNSNSQPTHSATVDQSVTSTSNQSPISACSQSAPGTSTQSAYYPSDSSAPAMCIAQLPPQSERAPAIVNSMNNGVHLETTASTSAMYEPYMNAPAPNTHVHGQYLPPTDYNCTPLQSQWTGTTGGQLINQAHQSAAVLAEHNWPQSVSNAQVHLTNYNSAQGMQPYDNYQHPVDNNHLAATSSFDQSLPSVSNLYNYGAEQKFEPVWNEQPAPMPHNGHGLGHASTFYYDNQAHGHMLNNTGSYHGTPFTQPSWHQPNTAQMHVFNAQSGYSGHGVLPHGLAPVPVQTDNKPCCSTTLPVQAQSSTVVNSQSQMSTNNTDYGASTCSSSFNPLSQFSEQQPWMSTPVANQRTTVPHMNTTLTNGHGAGEQQALPHMYNQHEDINPASTINSASTAGDQEHNPPPTNSSQSEELASAKASVDTTEACNWSSVFDQVLSTTPSTSQTPSSHVPVVQSLGASDQVAGSTPAKCKADDRIGAIPVTKTAYNHSDNVSLDWAHSLMQEQNYVAGVESNGTKLAVAMSLIRNTVATGQKIILFSQSLMTLELFEKFLCAEPVLVNDAEMKWKRNENYLRLQGSTLMKDRERMIDRFNQEPNVYLFLISTRAGSLGINLTSATRVIIMDASWNPCHDAQAVCRIYRYGQTQKTYIYRLIMDNCMERAVFNRQICKQGMFRRVIDEKNTSTNVTRAELENLLKYDEALDLAETSAAVDDLISEDDVLVKTIQATPNVFAQNPFLHESLMADGADSQLTDAEKREAKLLFERELSGNDGLDSRLNGPMSDERWTPSMALRHLNPTGPTKSWMTPSFGSRFQLPGNSRSMHAPAPGQSMSTPSRLPLVRDLRNPQPQMKLQAIRTLHPPVMLPSVTNPGTQVLVQPGLRAHLVRANSGQLFLRIGEQNILHASGTVYERMMPHNRHAVSTAIPNGSTAHVRRGRPLNFADKKRLAPPGGPPECIELDSD